VLQLLEGAAAFVGHFYEKFGHDSWLQLFWVPSQSTIHSECLPGLIFVDPIVCGINSATPFARAIAEMRTLKLVFRPAGAE
jgi:hypothetical protein